VLPGTEGYSSGSDQPEGPKPARVASKKDRDKLFKQIKMALGKMPVKPRKGGERLLDRGTAEVNAKTRHADVRFYAKQGQDAVADFLVSFILDAPENVLRQWHVFGR